MMGPSAIAEQSNGVGALLAIVADPTRYQRQLDELRTLAASIEYERAKATSAVDEARKLAEQTKADLAEAERLAAQAAADRAVAADDLRKAVAERKAAELARRETTGAQAEMSAFLRRANAALGGS